MGIYRYFIFVAVTGMVTACTVPNPLNCADGSCSDPTYPFCDVDGRLQGAPLTCIAVVCTPQEFAECRGDDAVICNSSGANYEIAKCENGCDAASQGCRRCSTSMQCSGLMPVCDSAISTCRACQLDAECTSGVCDFATGGCVPTNEVVVAAPSGLDSGACSVASPCNLSHAVDLAAANPLRSTVLAMPGTYSTPFAVQAGTITIVGPGATLIAAGTTMFVFNIIKSADVTIRGMRFDLSAHSGFCGGLGTDPGGKIHLIDTAILLDGLTLNSLTLALGCKATLENVDISVASHGAPGPALLVSDRVALTADRLRISTTDAHALVVFNGKQITARISNSVLDNVEIILSNDDTTTQSNYSFFFNTIVSSQTNAVSETTSGSRVVFLENNILTAATDAIACFDCTASHNVTFPQTSLIPVTNIRMDPRFVSKTGHDYHLTSVSPAIDVALPSTGLTVGHDFEGISRPQGAAPDIGAFERH